MRGLWMLGVVLSVGCAAGAQNFAIFSPVAIAKMPGAVDADTKARIVREADGALGLEPHPMAHPHTQHVLPSAPGHAASVQAQQDWKRMLAFGLAYRVTGEAKYLAAAERFLGATMAVWHSDLDPIDDTQTDQMMMTVDLTRGALTASTEKNAVATFRAMAEGYLKWMEQDQKNAPGKRDDANWTSHRAKLALLAAYETGDPALVARAERCLMAHVSVNVNADGSVIDYKKRDALHYVVFDLEPLETAALAEQAHGKDAFHAGSNGKTIVHGVEWLLPFATGEKQHLEFVHSTVDWDRQRDEAGVKGYSGVWDRSTSVDDLGMAFTLDPKFIWPLRAVSLATKKKPSPWVMVYAETRGGGKAVEASTSSPKATLETDGASGKTP